MSRILEGATISLGIISLALSYYLGERDGQQKAIDYVWTQRMDSSTMIETVSRYISGMSGFANSPSGVRQPYAQIAGKHNVETATLGDVPGKLSVNEPVVQILINLSKVEFESDPKNASGARKHIQATIGDPLKAFAKSMDPTIAAGALESLANITKGKYVDYGTISEFSDSVFQLVQLKDLDLSNFELENADFRNGRLEGLTFDACRIHSTRFAGAQLIKVSIDGKRGCTNAAVLPVAGAILGSAGQAGLILQNLSNASIDFSQVKTESGATNALKCQHSRDIELKATATQLHRSIFDDCVLKNVIFNGTNSLEASEFGNSTAKGARFGKNTLVKTKFNRADLSGSQLAYSGLDPKEAFATAKTPSTLDDAIFEVDMAAKIKDLANEKKIIINSQVWFIGPDGNIKGAVFARGEREFDYNLDSEAMTRMREDYCKANQGLPWCAKDWLKPLP